MTHFRRCLISLSLVVLAGCSSSDSSSQAGKEGTLTHGGGEILVAKSESDLGEITRITMSRDSDGERKMFREGTAFKVDEGTKVKVLDDDGGLLGGIRVRILSGPGVNQEGWVPSDYLK